MLRNFVFALFFFRSLLPSGNLSLFFLFRAVMRASTSIVVTNLENTSISQRLAQNVAQLRGARHTA